MAQYPVITSSSDKKLIQIIDEKDPKTLKVVHHINVAAGQNVRLGALEPIFEDTDPEAFAQACIEFGIGNPTADTFLIFNYDLYADPREYRTVVTFPKDSDGYLVPGKGKIVAIATINTNGGVASKTAGEAL